MLFNQNSHDSYIDPHQVYMNNGINQIKQLMAEKARENREERLKSARGKYLPSPEDYTKFWENHQSPTPTPPPESVFNGTTDLKVVKPVESDYYSNLYNEVQEKWMEDVQKALAQSQLPEGHPRRLTVTTEKL